MEIERLRVDIRKAPISLENTPLAYKGDVLAFDVSVLVKSRYLGLKEYKHRQLVGINEFESLFKFILKMAEAEISTVVLAETKAKIRSIKKRSESRVKFKT